MSLIFEQFLTEAMGDASYLIGDDSARVAAIIDPQVDIQRYLNAARRHGVALKYIFQTHVHEDFLSGAHALACAVPGSELCLSGHDAPAYGFAHKLVHDGDEFKLGTTCLTIKHTPGHTPEHISLLAAQEKDDAPFAVFSGGSLLVGAAGRTDLLGEKHVEALTGQQFRTLHDFFLGLGDGVALYPTHVHGSPCGAAIGDKISSTIGFERHHNPLLQASSESAFRSAALGNLPPKPSYYPRLKVRNTDSQPGSGPKMAVAPLPAQEFAEVLNQRTAALVDTRHMLAFGGGHIPKALNIGAAGHLSIWAGWMLDPDKPLLLVLDSDSQLPEVVAHFARTGFEKFAGYLAGGMSAWASAGLAMKETAQLLASDLADQGPAVLALDIRSPQEWKAGHVPGALHIFLPELPGRLDELSTDRPVAVYCDSGYRASIGASLLQQHGFDAMSVPGSWQAWRALDLPVER